METKTRSGSKSVIWRLFGVAILAIITYAYTRKWITTGLVTVIHHGVFLFVFYFHERIWLRVKRVRYRALFKMLTYETLCGNIILGTITYCITGDWKQMTAITLSYIGIKHVCYVFNEFVWDRIKIGTISLLIIALLTPSVGYGDYWTNNAVKRGAFGLSTEIRMDSEVYLKLIQLDWRYRLSDSFTMTLSEREIQTDKVEHSPMVSLTYQKWFIKNRMRVQYRIRDGEDIVRFRNKTTITIGGCFVALEAFVEKGRWYRNRYYAGVNLNKYLGLFIMKQTTDGDGVWVFGTNFVVEI